MEFEPDNIEDKNAIKFEVNVDIEWQIIGYCDVKQTVNSYETKWNQNINCVVC